MSRADVLAFARQEGKTMAKFGEYIKEKRKEKNMSASNLARASGLSITEISRLENGSRRSPNATTVYYLSKALNVTMEELVEIILEEKE